MSLRLAFVIACMLTACTNDYDKFEVVPAGTQDSGVGGTGGIGGTAGSATGGVGGVGNTGGGGVGGGGTGGTGGVGGTSGAPGGGGSGGSSCDAGQKPCASSCVPDDDPATGCAAVSCAPCSIANGTATCASGACAVQSCNGGFGDCSNGAADGCEQNLSQPNNQSCGSCSNDCSQQGFTTHFSCGSNLICQCTSADQCKDGGAGTAGCTGGLCSCSGGTCNGGERCRKSGPNQVCSCNGGAACIAGQVCCQTPAGCRDLTTDSANCGACGKVCPGGTACVSGSCQ